MESFEEEMDSLSSTLIRMSDAIGDIGDQLNQIAGELTTLSSTIERKDLSKNERQKYRSQVLQVFRRSSKEMGVFTKRMNQDIPLFRRHLDKSVSVFTRAAPIYLELNEGEDKDGWSGVITTLLKSMVDMRKSMEDFRDSVDALPRMATSLNRAKREVNRVLQEVVDVSKGGIASFEAVLTIFRLGDNCDLCSPPRQYTFTSLGEGTKRPRHRQVRGWIRIPQPCPFGGGGAQN